MMESFNLSIVIATKDRIGQLVDLLASIVNSPRKPNEIIVVSSGTNIDYSLNRFRNKLNIKHKHVDIKSQVFQKKLGISMISPKCQWVMFCDDDILFYENSIEKAYSICNSLNEQIMGIGFNTENENLGKSRNQFVKRKLFKLGNVKLNGVTTNYLKADRRIETKWLNGISLWRAYIVELYNPILINSEYSAYEDVFFSYQISKLGSLIFEPDLRVKTNTIESNLENNLLHFVSLTLNRRTFVEMNPEFSMNRLFIYEVMRLLKIIFSNTDLKSNKIKFMIKFIYNFRKIQVFDNQKI